MEKQLKLTNDGNLSLFFIGTGNAFSKKFFQTNLLVIKGENHLLIDCGSLCPYALETEYNLQLKEIKHLLLTHPHADHIGGVEELMLSGRYIAKNKIDLVITNEFKKKLWNESLKGGCHFSDEGKMTFDDYFNQVIPKKKKNGKFIYLESNIGNINVKLFRTRHVTTSKKSFRNSQISYGLIIDNKILFTGDTQFNKSQLDLILNLYDIKTIFHDCDISGYGKSVHASYEELKTLDQNIKNRMYLCHYNSAVNTVDCVKDGFLGFAKSGNYYNF